MNGFTKTIQSCDVYHQPEGIPDNLIIWQDENHGIAALTMAAQDVAHGETVVFALCDREGTFQPIIREIVYLAMGTGGNKSDGYQTRSPRYCGENHDPDGPGSHALISPAYTYCTEPAAIATAMALGFSHIAPHFFRLPNA